DIKFPSIGKDSIVFEQAGYIWRYDLASGQAAPVPIQIKEDFDSGRGGLVDASKHLESVNLAPDGERTIVVARGDLFSVPAKNGTPRDLSKTSGAHERDAVWSPDGKWIAYNSDATGENELYVRSQDGKSEPQQITNGGDTYYYAPKWSPDSKKLLCSDRLQRLRYVDVAPKAVTQVGQDKFGEIQGYNWSPDSQWITWARPEENDMPRVYLYSLANKQQTAVTDSWYGSGESVFSNDGKYLLLASARDFKPTFGDQEFANVYRDMQRVYLVTLAKETANPLAPKSDEVGKAAEKREKEKAKQAEEKKPEASPGEKKPEEKSKKPVVVKVDTDGIQNRIVGLEITPGNYRNTLDGKNMLVNIKKDNAIIDIPKDKNETKDHEHKIQGLDTQLDRHAEWRQIYFECWRQMRDFFFSPTMDGVDWKAMRDKYAALLPFVNHRNDLTYLLGELIGELNVGHAYVGGGERPDT